MPTSIATINSPPLALTSGDPASIGGELTIKAWQERYQKGIAPFVYIGDANHLQKTAEEMQLKVPIQRINKAKEATEIFDEYLPVLHQELAEPSVLGAPNTNNSRNVIKSIETAVELVQAGQCRALTTNAIAKNILYQIGFKYPGHTEFLEHLSNKSNGESYKSVMMLASNLLRVVPVTIHIPLMEVGAKLNTDLIYDTAKIVVKDLQNYFGIERPKLAIAGLNPHAGEDGAMGKEDLEVVAIAVKRLKADGYDVNGPMPADTMFHKSARSKYDVALGMYHDQVLIPIKTLDFDNGVNVTLGLPFIRTSPDHGTAFDIAGQGIASPNSLIAALKLAHKMANYKLMSHSHG